MKKELVVTIVLAALIGLLTLKIVNSGSLGEPLADTVKRQIDIMNSK